MRARYDVQVVTLSKAMGSTSRAYLTRHLAELLARKTTRIEPVLLPVGADSCVPGHVCYCSVWDSGQANKFCMYHGPEQRNSLHDDIGRAIVDLIYSLDNHAYVLPEFVMQCKVRQGNGRFGVSNTYKIDILVVLSDGRRIAIELDGGSHQDCVQKARDEQKDSLLLPRGVEVCRVDIKCSRDPNYNELCTVWNQAIAKVRAFVNQANSK